MPRFRATSLSSSNGSGTPRFSTNTNVRSYGLVLDAGRGEWEFLYAYWLNQYGLGRQRASTGLIEVLMPTLIKP